MADAPFDLDALASPLSAESPSGDDLEYDAQFIELGQAAAGKPETQFGPGEPPDWLRAQELALELAGRTRDLRLAVQLARCGARLQGLGGYAHGLALAHRLLEAQWPTVHPQLDASDGDDPTMRVNSLAPLAAADAALGDLRAATVAPVRNSLTVRELELGLGGAEPTGDEAQPTEAGVLDALRGLMAQHPEIAEHIALTERSARGIAEIVDTRGGSAAPELKPLVRLASLMAGAVQRVLGEASADDGASLSSADAPAAVGGVAVGAIRNRADAVRALDSVCAWIERNEPSHPAPLLIRRAQRLMTMNFIEIMRDLAPDGLTQVGTVAGVDPNA